MKKVLYIWKSAYPFEIRIQKICESLAKAGYSTRVVCYDNASDKSAETVNNVEVRRIIKKSKLTALKYAPMPGNFFWKAFLRRQILEFKPDIIINREMYLMRESAALAREFNIPIVIDMAEHYPAAMRTFKKYQSPIGRFITTTLALPDKYEKMAVDNSDAIITVCKEQNERLINQYSYAPDKMVIAHNTPLLCEKESLNKSFNSDEIIFVHHGYLSGDKSIANFLKGFELACDARNDIRFIVAGDGECKQDYDKLVSGFKHKDKITLTGKYKYYELSDIIQKAHIGVIPLPETDFNNHTIHNKVFDYFAHKLPVLVSDNKPLLRLISETRTGVSHNCESPESCRDAILKIADMDLSTMSQNAYKAYIEKYNWENDFSNLLEFLKRLSK
jgi:glycosyltransferase involved in cell wall biosynthesis